MEYIKPPLSSARNIKQLAYCEYKATNTFQSSQDIYRKIKWPSAVCVTAMVNKTTPI